MKFEDAQAIVKEILPSTVYLDGSGKESEKYFYVETLTRYSEEPDFEFPGPLYSVNKETGEYEELPPASEGFLNYLRAENRVGEPPRDWGENRPLLCC